MDIEQLESGAQLTGERFLLATLDTGTTKKGDPYLALELIDETGRVPAKQWKTADSPAEPGDVVEVDGQCDTFKGGLQVYADELAPVPDADAADYAPSAHRPPFDLLEEVLQAAHAVCSPMMFDLLVDVLGVQVVVPQRGHGQELELSEAPTNLLHAPAAKRNHHARLGGLVEHIHSMVEAVLWAADHYAKRYDAELDRGLLLAACILHDAGKLTALSGPLGTQYTERGQREGHISLVLQQLDQRRGGGLGPHTYRDLRHCILAHHGRQEWGSPVEPQTPEAQLLHQVDMLDSRMDPALSDAEGGAA